MNFDLLDIQIFLAKAIIQIQDSFLDFTFDLKLRIYLDACKKNLQFFVTLVLSKQLVVLPF